MNPVAFTVANRGKIAVGSGVLEITLKDPEGGVIASRGQPFSLAVGESKSFEVPLSVPPLKFGAYTLGYTQSDETQAGKPTTVSFQNTGTLALSFDRASYKIRELANLSVEVKNTGKYRWDSVPLTISFADASYTSTKPISLDPGQSGIFSYDIPIPEATAAGQHGVNAFLGMAGSSLEKTAGFSVPESSLVLSYSGPSALAVGDTIILAAGNQGGVDTQVEFKVSLGGNKATVYQNTVLETIAAGSTRTYSFQIPSQAQGGRTYCNPRY